MELDIIVNLSLAVAVLARTVAEGVHRRKVGRDCSEGADCYLPEDRERDKRTARNVIRLCGHHQLKDTEVQG